MGTDGARCDHDVGDRGHQIRLRAWGTGAVATLLVLGVLATAAGPAAASTSAHLNGGAVARAAADAGPRQGLVAFSDTNPTPTRQQATSMLDILHGQYCRGKGDPGPALSQAQALSAARKIVTHDSHGGLHAVSRGVVARSEANALEGSVAGLAAGRPAAALAALLEANHLNPNDAVPLIDMGALLAQSGHGRAALAVLKAADKRKPRESSSFDVSWAALADNSRGQALIVTHQYKAAVSALSAAVKKSPLLTEADQNLAVAKACQGSITGGYHWLVAGAHRQQFDKTDDVDTGETPPEALQPSPKGLLDTSHGLTVSLPNYVFPSTMDIGAAQLDAEVWTKAGNDLFNLLMQGHNAEVQPYAGLQADLKHASALTQARTRQILSEADNARFDPDLKALADRAITDSDDVAGIERETQTPVGIEQTCWKPGMHGLFLSDVQAFQTSEDQFTSAVYERETAIAANLSDPNAYDYALARANVQVAETLALIETAGRDLATYDLDCVESGQEADPGQVVNGEVSTGNGVPCPSSSFSPKFNIKLGDAFTLSVSCEKVSIELSDKVSKWWGDFISVSHDFGNGSTTVFGGVKAGTKLDGLIDVSGKAGAYVKFDSDGSVDDIGVKVGASTGAPWWSGSGASVGPSLSTEGSIGLAGAFK